VKKELICLFLVWTNYFYIYLHHINKLKHTILKIHLTAHDIKTLKLNDNLWSYTIKTRTGKVIGSCIDTKEAAIEHAENQLAIICRKMLSK